MPGEVCFDIFSYSTSSKKPVINIDVKNRIGKECCVKIIALADTTSTDYYKNDQHTSLFYFDRLNTGLTNPVKMYLQKNNNGWNDLLQLTNTDYGKYYPHGFINSTDSLTSYAAYTIEWKKVLQLQGVGDYRIRCEHTDINGVITNEYSFNFCLDNYTSEKANQTTRVDWYIDGLLGDVTDDELLIDYRTLSKYIGGGGWFNQIRLPNSFFGKNKSNYTKEFVKYSNGKKVYLKDEQVEIYQFTTGRYDYILHSFIKTNILQSDRIVFTDYNALNDNKIVAKEVVHVGNYEPNYTTNSILSRVTTEFEQRYQNRKKLRC